MPACRDAGDPDRIRISSDDRALEWQIGSLARFQLDESSSKIVGPAAKGPICVILLSQPFHGCPNFSCELDQSGCQKVTFGVQAGQILWISRVLIELLSEDIWLLGCRRRRCAESVIILSVLDLKRSTDARPRLA